VKIDLLVLSSYARREWFIFFSIYLFVIQKKQFPFSVSLQTQLSVSLPTNELICAPCMDGTVHFFNVSKPKPLVGRVVPFWFSTAFLITLNK
jgi:hypothetical protein